MENPLKAPRKTLSKKALNKSYFMWSFFHMSTLGFERMQAFGFLSSMLPVIKELHGGDKEKEIEAMQRHSAFFNVEPIMGTVIPGIAAALEETAANGEDIGENTINDIKVGLMGPLSGIGDSLFQGLLNPIFLSIGISLAANGNATGPLFYALVTLTLNIVISYYLFFKGYSLGIDSVDILLGENSKRIQESFSILGLIVIGAIGASFVSLNVDINILKDGSMTVQGFLDSLFPSLLPLSIMVGTWWLSVKKQVKPTTLILLLSIMAFIGSFFGIL